MLRSSVAGGASFELAVTVLLRVPLPATGEPLASSSAWLKVCVAVQVIVSVGASVVLGQAMSLLSLLSERLIPVSVTWPVFVTR